MKKKPTKEIVEIDLATALEELSYEKFKRMEGERCLRNQIIELERRNAELKDINGFLDLQLAKTWKEKERIASDYKKITDNRFEILLGADDFKKTVAGLKKTDATTAEIVAGYAKGKTQVSLTFTLKTKKG